MKGKRNRSCVVLLCLCLVFPIGAAADDADDESFSNIFVFGNSLSDTGNAAEIINAIAGVEINLCHPVDLITGCGDLFFNETRVSNGPVAVEVPADRLGLGELQPSLHPLVPFAVGTNFAVAGATARGASVIDLPGQLLGFRVRHSLAPPDPDALYVVFIGGNDIIDAVDAAGAALAGSAPASVETPEGIIASAVDAIADNIELLIDAGARNILVVNAPNIGAVPAIGSKAEDAGIPSALLRGLATFLTIKFNRQLAERVDEIGEQQEELGIPVEIEQFNLFRFFGGVRIIAALFGLNTVDACFDSETYLDTGGRSYHPDCGEDKFDGFVFFDDLHPTGRVHAIVGKALSVAARELAD